MTARARLRFDLRAYHPAFAAGVIGTVDTTSRTPLGDAFVWLVLDDGSRLQVLTKSIERLDDDRRTS